MIYSWNMGVGQNSGKLNKLEKQELHQVKILVKK